MAERKFAVRFSVADMEKTKADLQQFGASGAAAIRGIDQASMKATPSLKALDHAAGEVRSQFDQFANQIPVVGGALKALGPAGTAAAAGIGVVTLGFGAMWQAAEKALDALDDLNTQAQNAGLSAESFQAIQLTGIENDVENLAASMMTLEKNAAEAAAGAGKLFTKLKDLHPEILEQLIAAKTQEDRWDAVATAMRNAADRTEQVQIATAAFGKQGAQLVRILEQSDGSIASLTNRYRELGLIIDEKTIQAADEADRRLDILHKKMEVQWTQAFATFIPVVEGVSEAFAGAAIAVGTFFDQMNRTEDQAFSTIVSRVGLLHERLDGLQKLQDKWKPGSWLPDHSDEIFSLRAQIDLLEANLAERRKKMNRGPEGSGEGIDPAANKAAEKAAEKKAADDAAEAKRREAAALKLLLDLRKEDAAEAKKWQDVIDGNRTATEKAEDALNDLFAAYYLGKVSVEQYGAALPILTQNLNDAQAAAEAATPAIKAIEEARQRISDAARSNMSEAQAVAAEKARLDALIGSKDAGGVAFTAEEAAKALDAYKQSLHDTKDGMFELRAGAELLNEALDGQIKTIGDVGKVFLKVIRQMVTEYLLAQQTMSKGGGGDWLSALMSVFTGGGSSPSSNSGHTAAGVHHDGRQIGDASSFRVISLNAVRNARRAHTGFAPDEYPIIAQTGERMLSRTDNATFTRAIERLAAGGGGGGVSIKIVDETGSRFETNERASADGGRELEIRVKKIARSEALSAMGSPDGARVMSAVYGVGRKVS